MKKIETYEQALRKRLVLEFINTNKRSPTREEINDLLALSKEKLINIESYGFVGEEKQKHLFMSGASASKETINQEALIEDFKLLNTKLDSLIERETLSFSSLMSFCRYEMSNLSVQEAILDSLILSEGKDNVFSASIDEKFLTEASVLYPDTNAEVIVGGVSLGFSDTSKIEKFTISSEALSEGKVLSFNKNSPNNFLFESDGNFWKAQIKTKENKRTSLALTLSLKEPKDVSRIKIAGIKNETNSKIRVNILYSTNKGKYESISISELEMDSSTTININKQSVTGLKILFSKDKADTKDVSKNEYEFNFLLDQIEISEDTYSLTKNILVCGPYYIKNINEEDVYFTKAVLSSCELIDDNTSVNYYLSQDGEEWISASSNGSNYVSFASEDGSEIIEYHDGNLLTQAIVEDSLLFEEVNSEAYLNTIINEPSKVDIRTLKVLRNTSDNLNDYVLGFNKGWNKNSKGEISTTLYVDSLSGISIDFGSKGAFFNKKYKTGLVYLPYGYTEFVTNESNWSEVEFDLLDEKSLKSKDMLYPYNHKLLIEGYNYSKSFKGNKPYQGVKAYFGKLLEYKPIEQFESLDIEDNSFFNCFTIEERDSKLYLKVKVDKSSSTWKSETIKVQFSYQSNLSNVLFVKAVLNTDDEKKSPLIKSFNIRLI